MELHLISKSYGLAIALLAPLNKALQTSSPGFYLPIEFCMKSFTRNLDLCMHAGRDAYLHGEIGSCLVFVQGNSGIFPILFWGLNVFLANYTVKYYSWYSHVQNLHLIHRLLPTEEVILSSLNVLLWVLQEKNILHRSCLASFAEKDLRVLLDTELSMSQEYDFTAKANGFLGCLRQSTASRLKQVVPPLCSVLVRPHLECWIQFWVPWYKRDMDILKKSPEQSHQDAEGPAAPLLW